MNDDQELIQVQVPFADGKTKELRVGQRLLLNGVIYGARDAAHLRLIEVLEKGEDPPVDLRLQVIYYVGPTPPQPGRPCGAAGPTTSSRMDRYTPQLLEYGVRGLIGKGRRSPEVINAIKKHGAVYLAATGGAGALIGRCIKEMEVVAYPDLGPEAIYRITVENLPVTVAIDSRGENLYETGPAQYRRI
ncbi:MAG: Fe-S-containing hydro-lyase [Syntrophomonadaceae bacterium]|jgi:fumarate hydratase subunit beta|nr:Fe-S-containing hydro-lyase [Thermoanaerobacterales bacterium]NLN21377.1 Fe-S-containing hydro-lyase [Syntrophomonadaceae bacterium]HAF17431.1 Fe-S-containing hydro-lyase [Peptococcaceae bacterium]